MQRTAFFRNEGLGSCVSEADFKHAYRKLAMIELLEFRVMGWGALDFLSEEIQAIS